MCIGQFGTHALSLIVYWAVWYTGLDSLCIEQFGTHALSLIVYWTVWYTGPESDCVLGSWVHS